MKIAEAILSVFVIIGITFKVLHYPGAGPILILSLGSLSMMYFAIGFILFSNLSFKELGKVDTFKNMSTLRLVGAAGTGLALSISCIGIMFKFQFYPGADAQILVATISLGVVFVLSVFKWVTTKSSYYTNILKRVVVYFSIVIIFFIVPSDKLLAWEYPNNPEYVNALLKAQANPGNEALWEAVEIEREKMYDQQLAIPLETED